MGSVNKVILIGNLGKDPEIKNFDNGGMIAEFTLATTDSYFDKEKNQRVDLPTDWHRVVVKKSGLARVAQQYLHKGSQVYVEGRLKTRSFQGKEGETKYITEIVVDELVMTGRAPDKSDIMKQDPPTPPEPQGPEDLPF